MKRVFALIALGSVSALSADQYYQGQSGYQTYPSQSQPYSQQEYQTYYQEPRGAYSYSMPSNSSQQYYQQENQPYYQNTQVYPENRYQENNRTGGYGQSYYQTQPNTTGSNSYAYQQTGNQPQTMSDQEITKKIRTALSSGWFTKGYDDVTFDVRNGTVTLRGTVETPDNKDRVEETVKRIDGVKQVNNQLVVTKGNSVSLSDSEMQKSETEFPQDFAATSQDRMLNAKIREKLNGGWLSKGYQTLVIKTTDGVVVITGTVDKPEDIKKISDQVKSIEGVRSINNRAVVK